MVQERIEIVVTDRGTRRVKRNIGSIGQESVVAAQGVNLLRKALLGFSAFTIIRGLGRTADSFTDIQNALRLVTDSTSDLNNVTNDLLQISNETRTSLDKNADFFRRLTLATRELGVSQERLLNITRSINQAIQISGASTKEAENGLIQLAQGLSSGGLRGDELRSVLEQLPAVADVIADRLGVTRGELRSLGAQFRITSGVIVEGFEAAADGLNQRFARVVPTISQSLQVLENSFTVFLGRLDRGVGGTRLLSSAIIGLANNLDNLFRALVSIAGAFISLKLATYIQSISRARSASAEFAATVASGNAVVLGSLEAERQQAVAAFESAAANFAAADAELVRAKATVSSAVVLQQKSASGLREVEVLNLIAASEQRLALETEAVSASRIRLSAAEEAVSASRARNLGAASASTEAELALAQAQLTNAQASVANTEASLSNLSSELARAKVVEASTQAQFAAAASTQTLTALEAEAAAAETALTAAIARRDAATRAATVSQGLYSKALTAVGSALKSLTSLLFANPLTSFITVLGTTIALLVAFEDRIRFGSDGVATLGDVAGVVFDRISNAVSSLGSVVAETFALISGLAPDVFNGVEPSFENFLRLAAVTLDTFVGFFRGAINIIEALFGGFFNTLEIGFISLKFSLNESIRAARELASGNFANAAGAAENAAAAIGSGLDAAFSKSGQRLADATIGAFNQGIEDSRIFETTLDGIISDAQDKAAARLTNDFGGSGVGGGAGSDRTGAVDAIIEQLKEEQRLLMLGNAERALEQEYLQITRKLRQEGVVIEEGSLASIQLRTQLEKNAATERQIAFQQEVTQLQQEATLLEQTTRERQLQNTLLQLRNQIAGEGGTLTSDEQALLESLALTNLELAEEAELLQQINGPLQEYETRLNTINRLLQKNKISQDQYNQSVRDLRIQALETSTSLEGGLERGLLKTQKRLEDLASTGEQAVVQSFQAVEDSLVSLARTGEFNFQKLVDTILDGLARIASQQLVQGILSSIIGGVSTIGGAPGATAASGGSVSNNQSFLVGEKGPEIFTPPGAGKIIPAGPTSAIMSGGPPQGPPPQVNVRVVNVMSEDEATQALDTPAGEQLVMNIIRRNRRSIKGDLA